MDEQQATRIGSGQGFLAALDQSGGSTPKALAEYGIPQDSYSGDEQMFDRMHEMRTRVITSPPFDDRILAAILFTQTMERQIAGQPSGDYLWEKRGIVPFVKVDAGLADAADGVQLMKPIDGLADTLRTAVGLRMFGTKTRSFIKAADEKGIAAIVDQQFAVARQVAEAGLVPILEPEVDIHAADKAQAEQLLLDTCLDRVAGVDWPLMFKVSIPTEVDHYAPLIAAGPVLRVVALSGGYERDEACRLLAPNAGLIASFSRALLQGLTAQQSDEEFDATLEHSVGEIYAASIAP